MMQEKSSEPDTTNRSFSLTRCFYGENILPDLNDLLGEAVRHPKAYGEFKRNIESKVINVIRTQLKGWKANHRIRLDITWGEKSTPPLRDYDNVVSGGRKIINDALVKTKTIVDDNPRFVGYGNNVFDDKAERPYIRVEIVEIEEFKK